MENIGNERYNSINMIANGVEKSPLPGLQSDYKCQLVTKKLSDLFIVIQWNATE